jgi:hypothetical protein
MIGGAIACCPGRLPFEVKDIETGQTVKLMAADWDDNDKRVAVAQLMRPAGRIAAASSTKSLLSRNRARASRSNRVVP